MIKTVCNGCGKDIMTGRSYVTSPPNPATVLDQQQDWHIRCWALAFPTNTELVQALEARGVIEPE